MTDPTHSTIDEPAVEEVTRRWERALADRDVEALVACYAPDATLESPMVPHIRGDQGHAHGTCEGRDQLRPFLTRVLSRTPPLRQYHRAGFFTDGLRATWEYPRLGPDGEQMDFVEVMEIRDGLIRAHRVYWGWRGVGILVNDEYHR